MLHQRSELFARVHAFPSIRGTHYIHCAYNVTMFNRVKCNKLAPYNNIIRVISADYIMENKIIRFDINILRPCGRILEKNK